MSSWPSWSTAGWLAGISAIGSTLYIGGKHIYENQSVIQLQIQRVLSDQMQAETEANALSHRIHASAAASFLSILPVIKQHIPEICEMNTLLRSLRDPTLGADEKARTWSRALKHGISRIILSCYTLTTLGVLIKTVYSIIGNASTHHLIDVHSANIPATINVDENADATHQVTPHSEERALRQVALHMILRQVMEKGTLRLRNAIHAAISAIIDDRTEWQPEKQAELTPQKLYELISDIRVRLERPSMAASMAAGMSSVEATQSMSYERCPIIDYYVNGMQLDMATIFQSRTSTDAGRTNISSKMNSSFHNHGTEIDEKVNENGEIPVFSETQKQRIRDVASTMIDILLDCTASPGMSETTREAFDGAFESMEQFVVQRLFPSVYEPSTTATSDDLSQGNLSSGTATHEAPQDQEKLISKPLGTSMFSIRNIVGDFYDTIPTSSGDRKFLLACLQTKSLVTMCDTLLHYKQHLWSSK